jgi:hypothetical protein
MGMNTSVTLADPETGARFALVVPGATLLTVGRRDYSLERGFELLVRASKVPHGTHPVVTMGQLGMADWEADRTFEGKPERPYALLGITETEIEPTVESLDVYQLTNGLLSLSPVPEGRDTQLSYFFRDSGNWKCWNDATLGGRMSYGQWAILINRSIDGYMFCPDQVGLEGDKTGCDNDGTLFELSSFGVAPNGATPDMSVGELVDAFREVDGGWRMYDDPFADLDCSSTLHTIVAPSPVDQER